MDNKNLPSKETFMEFVGTNTVAEDNYYAKAYDKILLEGKPCCWNFGAAFFGPAWFLYRKMYLYAILAYAVASLINYVILLGCDVDTFSPDTPFVYSISIGIFWFIISGLLGTKIYCHWTIANIHKNIRPKAKKTDVRTIITLVILNFISMIILSFVFAQEAEAVKGVKFNNLSTFYIHGLLVLNYLYLYWKHHQYYKEKTS